MKTLAAFLTEKPGDVKNFKAEVARATPKTPTNKPTSPAAADTGSNVVKAKQDKLAAERKAADAAGKKAAAQAKQDKLAAERKAADAAAKKVEAQVREPKKETQGTKPAGPSKPADTQERRRAEADKRKQKLDAKRESDERRAEGKKNIERRKSGVGGGIRSALGGDVIGMRGRKGESPEEKEERQDMNRKNRGEFAKKQTQGAVRRAFTADKMDVGVGGEGQARSNVSIIRR